MLVVQQETPCDLVIYGTSLRCLSVNRTAAVNLTWRRVPGVFELLCFTVAQTMLRAPVSNVTTSLGGDPSCKTQLGEPFY